MKQHDTVMAPATGAGGPQVAGSLVDTSLADGAQLLNGPGELIFAAVAPDMVARGWSVFPQESTGERRLPGKISGRTIKWSEDHDLANKLPTPKFLQDCVFQCATLNVACVFGPASGHTFAVDIDVTDQEMVDVIVDLAEEILGPTPFMRVGRAPKIAMIYRHGPSEDEVVASTSRHFAQFEEDGTVSRSGHGLEILGATRLITFHGRHHKTGNYFRWIGGATPLLDGPMTAPLVTANAVQTFLEAVDARYRFHRGASFKASSVSMTWDEAAWRGVPRIALAAGGTPWVEGTDGLIEDGREAYLTSIVYHTISALKGELDTALASDTEAVSAFKDKVLGGVLGSFQAGARMEARGRWSERELPREAWGKVSHLISKYVRGNVKLYETVAATRQNQPVLTMPVAPPATPTAPRTGLGERLSSQVHNARAGQAPDGVAGELENQDADILDGAMPVMDEAFALAGNELDYLRSNAERIQRSMLNKTSALRGTVEPMPPGSPDMAIQMDRGPISDMVQTGLDAAFAQFFGDVYGDALGYGPLRRSRVHVLKAPTGAGKTTRCIRTLAADPRTYQDHSWTDPEGGVVRGRMPWVMLLPTYANIDELRARAQVLNLDGNLDDAGLRLAASAAGLIGEEDLDSRLEELRRDALNCGLRTMVYSGKLRAGCQMSAKVELAMAAGIGTAALCKATVRKRAPNARRDEPGELVEEICPYYDGCPAIMQREQIGEVDVVFAPHSFLALSIPPELERVRGVIADERVHHLFLHTATFSATSLSIQRKLPRLSAREREAGMVPEDLLAERDLAAWIALDAMRGPGNDAERCPANALDRYRPDGLGPGERLPGLGLVRSALRVCSSAIQRDGQLSPATPLEEVRAMCARPTGRELREEWQFWSIIEDRIMSLRNDGLIVETIAAAQAELDDTGREWAPHLRASRERSLARVRTRPLQAHGSHDYRIQLLTDPAINGGAQEMIRISWRTKPNWPGVPVLLLDASAAPPIVAKIWNLDEADIVSHDVVEDTGRALNVKIVGVVNQTFSNSSIAASASASQSERQAAARNLANVRAALSAVSSLYGHGRVVMGTSIVLRELINQGWAAPDNIDACHFGAMRGLDGFKNHSAAISIGRMEPPTRTIDGLVAALTYDDPDPEEPFDRKGDGTCPRTGETLRLPLGEQRLRLRSGHVAVLKVPMFEGRWARLLQRQYREEEQMQFVGRLRPVYRQGRTPVWIALSSVIPDELVVDDLITIDDLLQNNAGLWEAVRRTGGIAEPDVLCKMCPDLFRTPRAAQDAMDRVGFVAQPDQADGPGLRASQGFATWVWHNRAGQQRLAFVHAHLADGEARLRTALGRRLGRLGMRPAWRPDPGVGVLAKPRAPDAVDKRIGAHEQRALREDNTLNRVGELLLCSTGDFKVRDYGVEYPYASSQFTVQQVGAIVAIEGFWAAKEGAADDRLMPMPTEAAPQEGVAQTYDQMGASVTDGIAA